ncbi:uncharacterized protein LOC128889588 [Hylaeus anthracinus]|uniref:uncharacterized protein LOC128889588 n=1 Tax=Hylaeus anthracinus TaxID=313031 RepID=UPI0023B97514|nr:uncharacterized protein LOC128889588 [Hylaeus anthracinus]
MFDKMAIRQHVDYYKDRFVGSVDCGVNIECHTTKVARDALVFLTNCLHLMWKLPIAYYLINGITADQKQNTWFKHPANDTKVNVYLDSCHMSKLVRNTVGTAKKLLDNNNDKIKWKHFEELHEMQEKENLHLGNKLRTKRIDFYKNKMKVKLASQLLSTSANALELCKNSLQRPHFQDC